MSIFILACYFGILGMLCVFGWHRIHITYLFKKYARSVPLPNEKFDELPMVTVQLPVYNEKFVIERLIDAVAEIDYPRDRMYIQVLDDSTDETRELAYQSVLQHRKQGLNIDYIHRTDRVGFKAGALEAGLQEAKGDFVAIFDADFIPNPHILKESIHYFTDPDVGMVQTRWEHLNREHNTLTQVQAILLDAHFMIEHGGRCYSDRFFNFNGTAGIWRRQAIADAGGWQHDTLTEDLDLSYRAQMRGWRFLFLPDLTCPAELPTDMVAFKSQQHRWAKGSIQVMKKLLPLIWRSHAPLKVKIEATFHLTGNLAYLLMIINSIFFVIPSMVVRQDLNWTRVLLIDGPLFLLASVSFVHFYLSSQHAIFQSIKGRKRFIPALMALGIGLGLNNARAVVSALFGRESEFVRTPKTGMGATRRMGSPYFSRREAWAYAEIAIGAMYTGAIIWAIGTGTWASIPFLVLFQNGFLFVGCKTLWEHNQQRRLTLQPIEKTAA
ncbi:MAG: glycosyltransferase [Acidobacteria bacterium]|nr:glycosyltransferase [Acidobacteriota bacterium]